MLSFFLCQPELFLFAGSLDQPVDLNGLISLLDGALCRHNLAAHKEEGVSCSIIILHDDVSGSAIVEDHIKVSGYRHCWYLYLAQ